MVRAKWQAGLAQTTPGAGHRPTHWIFTTTPNSITIPSLQTRKLSPGEFKDLTRVRQSVGGETRIQNQGAWPWPLHSGAFHRHFCQSHQAGVHGEFNTALRKLPWKLYLEADFSSCHMQIFSLQNLKEINDNQLPLTRTHLCVLWEQLRIKSAILSFRGRKYVENVFNQCG